MRTRPHIRIVTTLVLSLLLAPTVLAQNGSAIETHETHPNWYWYSCDAFDSGRVQSRLASSVATSWRVIHDGQMGYSWTIERCTGSQGDHYRVTKDHTSFEGFDFTLVLYDIGPEKETKVVPFHGNEHFARQLAYMEAERWPTYEARGGATLYGFDYTGSFQTDTLAGTDGEVEFDGCSFEWGAIPPCIHATAATVSYLG